MAERRLYYLTGTGNSLKIAKDLQASLGDCSLHSMPKSAASIEGDTVGLVFPVYFARPPVFVQEFIERAVFGDISYLFLVANGGGLFGTVLKILETQLKGRGQKVDAGFLIGMPGNHPKIASLLKTTPETYYAREKRRIEEISKVVLKKTSHRVETNLGPIGWFFSHVAFNSPLKLSRAHRLDEAFQVTDQCIGCGTCEQVCPVGNIRRDESTGRPTWQHRCVNCLACYHHCPQEAIELSGMNQMKRYRHPEIPLEEIAG
jgi:ferredoxin